MTTHPMVIQQRIVVWFLRVGFFAFGAFMLVQGLRNDYFGPYGPIQGTLLIILSFLIGAATRQRRVGWALLTVTVICTVLPLVGSGLSFDLAGGNKRPRHVVTLASGWCWLGSLASTRVQSRRCW